MKKRIESAIKLSRWLVVATLILGVSSCLKNDNTSYSVQVSAVTLINASPQSGALDFVSDGNRNYLVKPFKYDTVLPYQRAYPGFRVFGVTPHKSFELLASQQFYLKPGMAYSLFVTDTIGEIKLVLLKDSLDKRDSSKATVRFANMSADAPALTLQLSEGGGDPQLFENTDYGKATDFEAIESSDNYTLTLVTADTNEEVASETGVKLETGKIYTIWARGVYSSDQSETKLGIKVMENR